MAAYPIGDILSVADLPGNEDGWGPTAAMTPSQFTDIPFAPFSKFDRLGRVSDIGNVLAGSRFSRGARRWQQTEQINSAFFVEQDEQDGDFETIESRPIKSKFRGGVRFRSKWNESNVSWRARQRMYRGKQRLQQKVGGKQRQQPRRKKFGTNNNNNNGGKSKASFGWRGGRQSQRDPSVAISPDWEVVEDFQISALAKLVYSGGRAPAGKTVHKAGTLRQFNQTMMGVAPRTEQPLLQSDATFYHVTTSDDPVIQQLAMGGKASVFFTDSVLTALMCVPRSFESFDIVVNKVGDTLFFDKRDGAMLDLLTVDETASEPPTTEVGRNHINAPAPLAREAAHINQVFSQHVLRRDSKALNFGENPFVSEDETPAAVGYLYRQFELAGEVTVVVRCEVEAYGITPAGGERQLLTIKALNEYDSHATDWRGKIESQRGAVLATELKNNNCKIARWTAQSIIAGTDQIVLGFVTRLTPQQNQKHAIVGLQGYAPDELAQQINLVQANIWGIVEKIIDVVSDQPDGKYLLFRDPADPVVRMFAVPDNAFEDADDGAGPAGADAPAEKHTMESILADV